MGDSWTVYTKDGCPYCEKAVEKLKSTGSVKVKRGETHADEIAKKLAGHSHPTWPKIFKPDGTFLGGYSDL